MPYAGQVTEVQIPDGTIWEIPSGGGGGSNVYPATQTPLMDGVGAVGVETRYAREDHVHPSDSSKQNKLTAGSNITINGNTISATDTNTWKANSSTSEGYVASGAGQANKVWKTNASGVPAWRDDANTTYTAGTNVSISNGVISATNTMRAPATATPKQDGAGAVGTSLKYAREDHVHPTSTHSNHNVDQLSVASGVYQTLCNTGTLAVGTYLLNWEVSFSAASGGYRQAWLTTEPNGTGAYDRYSAITFAPATIATNHNACTIVRVTTATTFYLRCAHTAGTTLSVSAGIRVLKLHN